MFLGVEFYKNFTETKKFPMQKITSLVEFNCNLGIHRQPVTARKRLWGQRGATDSRWITNLHFGQYITECHKQGREVWKYGQIL